jgi:hypothetical protein
MKKPPSRRFNHHFFFFAGLATLYGFGISCPHFRQKKTPFVHLKRL